MRVLFVPLPVESHLKAQTQLAWALRAAGHQVQIAVTPDLTAEIMRTGLTGVPVGPFLGLRDYLAEVVTDGSSGADESLPDEAFMDWDDVRQRISDLTVGWFRVVCPDATVADLVAYARHWRPDLVIWDPMMMGAAVAAVAGGAMHVRLLFGTDRMGRLRSAFLRKAAGDAEDPLRQWLASLGGQYGLAFTEEMVLGRWTIDPMPSWVRRAPEPRYLAMRHVTVNGPGLLPDWLRVPPGGRRICLTLGASHRAAYGSKASVAALLEAVDGLDVEVVATFDADELRVVERVPDNVRPVDFVPLGALLPTCAAVVHHGGAGTFGAALEHGVPQLIIPSSLLNEERNWGPIEFAQGLHEHGAGVYVANSYTFTPQRLREHIVEVLENDDFSRRAAALRHESLARPAVAEMVQTLERLVADERR
ncbi:DUF1205 domain-containing protein [Dactylosporangium roseum]|uniref:DUF1205 domain-containing protein n=1 Tax=Dactylosporangium roseum TaxID=47989 RepID=A0ABY5YYG3_9ACTN|nr:nucleotide disphospho-sugar-binding domain-containing protein [Dactylosporangium roseum]UWZ34781.1 DUF1205 domain-containing protein [Dactylosporangium roseum]